MLDVVDELDRAAFYADYRAHGHGRPAHDPAMMVAVVLYAFSTGPRSAREIERRCEIDVAYRVVAGNLRHDHSTVARFSVRHEDRLAGLFGQILGLCESARLIDSRVVAIELDEDPRGGFGAGHSDLRADGPMSLLPSWPIARRAARRSKS